MINSAYAKAYKVNKNIETTNLEIFENNTNMALIEYKVGERGKF
jgi:hypothetical protein